MIEENGGLPQKPLAKLLEPFPPPLGFGARPRVPGGLPGLAGKGSERPDNGTPFSHPSLRQIRCRTTRANCYAGIGRQVTGPWVCAHQSQLEPNFGGTTK